MSKQLRYYIAKNGKAPLEDWLTSIQNPMTKARIQRRLERMTLGYYGDSKTLSNADGIKELRLDFGAGYRVYFWEHDDTLILLLCGGNKSTQKRDIQLAKKYLADIKRNL